MLLLLTPCLLWAQPDTDQLAARLANTEGEARLELLLELAAASREEEPARAFDWGTEALQLLPSFPDDDRELTVLSSLSLASARLRRHQEALHFAGQAERLARAKDRKPALALALATLGNVHRARADYARALDYSIQAAELYEELGDKPRHGSALSDVGVAYRKINNYSMALQYYFDSHRVSVEAGDRYGVARALNNIGIVYRQLEQYDKALDHYLRALEIREQEGNLPAVGRLLNNIGIVYKYTGDPARAIEFYNRSLKIKQELGDRKGISSTVLNLGLAYEQAGDLDRAMEHLRRSLRSKQQLGDKRGIANALVHIARMERKKGRYDAAIENVLRSLAISTEISAKDDLQDGYEELSKIYAETDRHREALAAFQEYERIKSEIYNERNSEVVAEMQTRFETGQKEREIEVLKQEQVIDALEIGRQEATRRALVIGLALSSLIILLLYSRYRIKSRSTRTIEKKNAELERTMDDLKESEERRRRLEKERVRQEERERYIVELEARKAEVEARNAEMERFTYTVSHDLKSPLITIRGFLGLVERDALAGDTERMKKNLARIDAAAGKMGLLLDELLQLSRIGRVVNELEEVPLGELAGEAAEKLAAQIGNRGAEVEIDPDLPSVFGDRLRLIEVLQNLMENAVKFMGDQAEPRVEVGSWQDDEETVLFVRDNGIGIDPRYNQKVFGLFDRLDPEIDGTGVGLALVKRIIEVHGGRIWIESEGAGHGSTFCFTLPANADSTESLEAHVGTTERGALT